MFKIVEQIRQFEETHQVEKYEFAGIRIWSFLRVFTYIKLFKLLGISADESGNKIKRYLKKLWFYLSYLPLVRRFKADHEEEVSPGKKDLVFLTFSGMKSAVIDHKYFDIYIDSLVNIAEEHKINTLVWEIQRPIEDIRSPRYRPFTSIRLPLDISTLVGHLVAYVVTPFLKRPQWFFELKSWLQSVGVKNVNFREILANLYTILIQSMWFSKWLKKIKPSALIIIGWYNYPMCSAAILAARKLGIKTVDLQHGFNYPSHFGYCEWAKGSQKEYLMLPDLFWVWSERDKKILTNRRSHVISPDSILVGGNPWLNMWRNTSHPFLQKIVTDTHQLFTSFEQKIVVTLPDYLPPTQLLEVIKDSPRSWLWLIRLHPFHRNIRSEIEQIFADTGHPNIDIHNATSIPLFAIFSTVDFHITFDSSTSIEALAFGLKTILIIERAVMPLKEYIDEGLMVLAVEKDEILDLLYRNQGKLKTPFEISAGLEETQRALVQLSNI